jgi:hypothetical protein
VDLSSYTVKRLQPHVELSGSAIGSGGLCGSSFLDRIFANYLQSRLRFGDEDQLKMRWLKNAVNKFEKDIKPTFTGREPDHHSYYIDVVGQRFENPRQQGIFDDTLEITARDIRVLIFDIVIAKIEGLVIDQINATRNVKAVLLVGGFGQNEYLQTRLREAVPEGIEVRAVENSRTAIVRGALMAGLSGVAQQRRNRLADGNLPTQNAEDDGRIRIHVVDRLAPKHFGVRAFENYNPVKHKNGENRKVPIPGSNQSEIEIIEWFVKMGDVVRDGDPKTFKLAYDKEVSKGRPEEIRVKIYSCKDPRPPDYPHTDRHPVPSVQKPLVELEIPLSRLPPNLPVVMSNGREFYHIEFEVRMTLQSASLSFVLTRGNETYEPKRVHFF